MRNKIRVTVELDDAVYQQLESLAARQGGRSIASLVREAITAKVEEVEALVALQTEGGNE